MKTNSIPRFRLFAGARCGPRSIAVHILLALALQAGAAFAGPGRQQQSLAPTQAGAPVPLTGEKAIQHLKDTGQYESLAAAITGARYGAKAADHAKALAQNPAHGIRSTFTPEGLRFEVRAGETTHQVVWRLESLGYGAAQIPVPPGELKVTGQRVEITRGDSFPIVNRKSKIANPKLVEWFHNTPGGLEHGFTLEERPASNPRGEPLRLVLAVSGDLAPQADAAGQKLLLRDAAGQIVVSYEKLKVWDATGAELPAALQVAEADGQVTLSVAETTARYPLTIDPTFTQQTYLKAHNTGGADPQHDFVNGDQFGSSVAVSGDTVVIGAPGEDSGATGVNGDGTNDDVFGAGAAYVFVRTGATWVQQAYLKASITDGTIDSFGGAVAVSGDTVVIGAWGEDSNATGVNGDGSNNSASASGAAYVFVRNGTTWTQQAYLKASNTGVSDFFGIAVAVSGDTVVIGAHREDSNATGVNGNGSNNSAVDSGAAYVFVRDGTTWTQQAYLKASNTGAGDLFGWSVAVSGNTVVVGARFEDSSAIGVNGVGIDFDFDGIVDDAPDSGAAYVFVRNGATWTQQAFLKPGVLPFDFSNFTDFILFGQSVSVSGDTVVVGAPLDFDITGLGTGAAYVFARNGTAWSLQARIIKSGGDLFDDIGNFVVVSGDTLAVSGVESPGPLVKVFRRSGTAWAETAKLKASNPGGVDGFGRSIAVSGDTVVIGAPFEESNATGIDGDSSNNSLNEAGAAYVFVVPSAGAPEIAVEQPSGTSLADGGNRAFGSVNVGANASLTFTLRNTGAANLTGLGITIDGTDAALFTVTASPTGPVAGPAGSATFTVRFAPTSAGPKTATLHLASNDADENPFDITLTGTGNTPSSLASIGTVNFIPAGLQLTLPVTAGQTVGIEYSETMSPGSWIDLGNVTVTDGIGAFTDTNSAHLEKPRGFYRALLR